MLPASLHDFLVASVGASASFIGLLFVALQFVMERAHASGSVERRDRILAESAYLALISILLISMVGLLPGGNVSWILCMMGVFGTTSTVSSAFRGIKKEEGVYVPRQFLLLLYGFMAIYGFLLVTHIQHHLNLSIFYTIVFMLYGVALGRAWALSGLEH
jgi:hypothetical protein